MGLKSTKAYLHVNSHSFILHQAFASLGNTLTVFLLAPAGSDCIKWCRRATLGSGNRELQLPFSFSLYKTALLLIHPIVYSFSVNDWICPLLCNDDYSLAIFPWEIRALRLNLSKIYQIWPLNDGLNHEAIQQNRTLHSLLQKMMPSSRASSFCLCLAFPDDYL